MIQETATVLCYKYGHKAVLPFLEHIREAGNIIIPPVSSIDDMKSFADLQKKVSFTDSTLIRLAKQSGAELVTFDKKMMSLARRS